MPKKHQPSFNKPASSYVHPSLSSSRSPVPSNAGPSSPRTVNERLNQLRREQAARTTADRRNEIAESIAPTAVHPAVRQILNLAEYAPPRPRVIARTANGRRVPGPAPPQSWLEKSRHAPEHVRQGTDVRGAGRRRLVRSIFPERMPVEGSLVHYTSKTLAENWDWLMEYEQHYLATLPIQLKDVLLSYLAVYGPEDSITPETLRTLFLNDSELEGATGSDDLKHLDLTGLITEKLSITDLIKYITQAPISKKNDMVTAMKSLKVSEDVAESWEEEAEADVSALPKTLKNVRFPSLTHLSLAHPQKPSWQHLLNLSTHLPTLTHLSLAFWPTPSMTPNATTASMTSKHGKVNLGGTHFYSEMDNDWQEAANILRRLANHTYCLKWLDVSGCDWTPALTWGIPLDTWIPNQRNSRRKSEDWEINHAAPGPDWNGSWQQVTFINISQGWIPNDINAIRALPAGLLGCELLSFLRSEDAKKLPQSAVAQDAQTGVQVRRWIDKEMENRRVADIIRGLRVHGKGPYCHFDFGWTPGRRPRARDVVNE